MLKSAKSQEKKRNILYCVCSLLMVPEAGLEPARPHQTLDFESNASTDSTIRAWYFIT